MLKKILIIRSNQEYKNLFKEHHRFTVLDEKTYQDEPDIIVFTGGPDVSPSLYGEPTLHGTQPAPQVEKLYKDVYDRHPNAGKIGICFGGQWLNVINGGAMWQDVNHHAIFGTHPLVNLLNTETGILMRNTFDVTSTHHQMMIAGEEGEVIGIASDPNNKEFGLATNYVTGKEGGRDKPSFDTEVVWYPKTKSLCFQPHPEFPKADDCRRYFFGLFEYFFE